MKKRIFSLLLCACMLLSLMPQVEHHTHAASTTVTSGNMTAGGWNETIWAKISGTSASSVTSVSWSGTASGSLSAQDLQYLVRDEEDGKVRIDVLGLKAGTYTLTVKAGSQTYTCADILVEAQDRSGYAHYNYTDGVGAYNDDGTLKANAIVLYVTNENKNTVSVTSKDGTTVTGIGNILGSTGMDVGGGLNSKGGAANTNQDILRKLAADGTPLVIRIIGTVKGASSTNLSSATSEIDGLTAYNSTDYGGTAGDNGFMARMSGGKDITIEGVGYNATIDGWGIHFICQTADYTAGYGRSFEVRNLTFQNVPEDCIGMEGQQEGSTLTAPVERCWIHNCSFRAPTISSPAESDKDGGDGACDFKRGNYMTMSYCYYEGYHKTNLVGSSDSSLQYHITWHHNYWKNCDSRGPLGRNANMHIYNCIYEGQTSYAMNPRANCYIFSEYNMFINCKNPVTVDSGAVKSYNDSFASCIGDNNATIVTDKSTTVSTSNTYANFDTNSSLSYIPSGDYALDESLTDSKAKVMAFAGAQKEEVVSAEDVDISVIPSDRVPTAAVVLPYSQSLNSTYVTAKSGTFDNIVFNVSKTASDSITVGGSASGCDIVFYVDRTVNISMTEVSGTYSPVLCNEAGVAVITGSDTATNLPAGYYFIQSGGYDVGSSKFKEAKVASLSIEAVVVHGENDHVWTDSKVVAPTCTEGGYTIQKCTCGAEQQVNATAAKGHTAGADANCIAAQTCTVCGTELNPALGHSYSGGSCTRCGAVDPASCAHGDTELQNYKDATCSAEGYTGDTFCNTCQTTIATGSAIAKLAHTGGDAATCTTAQTCTVCGATVTAALGHNYVDGVCTRCGAEDLAASGYVHNFTENGTTSDFYTIVGNLSDGKGSVTYNGLTLTQCYKMESYKDDNPRGITFTAPSAGTLTLVFGGTTSASGKAVLIDDVSVDIDSTQILTVPVTAGTHTIKKDDSIFLFYIVYAPEGSVCTHSNTTTTTVDATCTTAGSTTVTCSDCGATVSSTTIDALGHSYDAGTVTTAATCVATGVKTYTCATCSGTKTETIAATGEHTYVDGECSVCGAVDSSTCAHTNTTIVNAKEATCSEAGYTGDTYCNTCKTTIATGTTIVKKAHTPGAAATCVNPQKCTVCSTVLESSLGHSYGSDGKCTRDGCDAEKSSLAVGGWFETAWVEWEPVDGASGYNVYYSSLNAGGWTQIDTELIRNYGDYWRADIPGLKAGEYQLCVAPVINGKTGTHMHSENVTVIAHNRDGYAHTNGSVGAYNNDGTLKDGAIVVYVTKDNVDSVQATIGGTTYTGLQSILYDSRKTAAVICIRIIGEIGIPSNNTSGQIQIKENQSAITVEGIGEDATCNGWGFTMSTATNVEIRNLAFMNNASSEGDCVTLQKCTYCWVHNCDFFYGTDRGGDKNKGDGALDTKTSQYITHSFNHFWDCGKCNLQGSGTSDTSDNITYHHNWYDHSDSRHPRVRVATVHVYNNFYDGVAKYGIGNAYKAEVISEGNYFLNTKYPMLTSTQGSDTDNTMSGETPGTLTSYMDVVIGATSWIPNVDGIEGATSWSATDYDCIIVDTRFSGYSYTLQSAEDAKATVMAYAGRMGGGDFEWTFTETDNADYGRNAELDAALQAYKTTLVSVGGSSVTETHPNCEHTNTTTTTTPATCGAAGSTTETCDDCGKTISTTTIPATGNHTPSAAATCVDDQTCTVCGTVLNTATGEHNYVDGKCSVCGLIDPSSCEHTNKTTTTVDATCTVAGSTTVTCDDCGKTISTETIAATGHTAVVDAAVAATCTATGLTEGKHCSVCDTVLVAQTTTAALGHNYSGGTCTRCGASEPTADSEIHNFTDDGWTSTFYNFAGGQLTNGKHGTYTYDFGSGTETLNYALKFDSEGSVTFTPTADGTLTIAVASQTAGRTVLINDGAVDTVTIDTANKLFVLTVNVTAGTTYTVERGSGESGLYYIAYVPNPSGGDVHEHSYTETVTTAATCTTAGVMTYTCSCGDSYTEEIAALGHDLVNHAAQAPTCTAIGWDAYVTCNRCDHTTYVEKAALGHNIVVDEAVAPTCTETGLTEGSHCSRCNDATVAQEVVFALGHSYNAVVTAPTCTEKGYTTYTCSTCGDNYEADEVAATGHTAGEAVKENEVPSTNTTIGSYDSVVYCSVCGTEVSRENNTALLNPFIKTTMALNECFAMNFYINPSTLPDGENYAEIIKYAPDGSIADTLVIYQSNWNKRGSSQRIFTYPNIIAQEMSNRITVVIYSENGEQISEIYEMSAREYVMGHINTAQTNAAENELFLAMLVDMLNYGAEAQLKFNYNIEHLANSELTDAQKNYATSDTNAEDIMTSEGGYVKTMFSASDRIYMNFYFDKNTVGTTKTDLYIEITYKHFNEDVAGEPVTIAGTELKGSSTNWVLVFKDLYLADGYEEITVKVFDSSGALKAQVTDSVMSRLSRMLTDAAYQDDTIYPATLKFMKSSYAYFANALGLA